MADRLSAFLANHRRIALDTNIFIYQAEAHPRYLPLTRRIFSWLERPGSQAVTSTITMTELLVQPYRSETFARVSDYYVLLATYPNLEWIAPDLKIAHSAAQLRALHGLKTPDALQAATALIAGATAMITNDAAFGRVASFDTLVIDRLL